jgi:hypothetical protein
MNILGNQTDDAAANTVLSCKTYGAFYSWHTAMALNGRTAGATAVPLGQRSNVQGICPDGWFLPSDFDWGTMLNAIEDSCTGNFTEVSDVPPCDHNRYRDTTTLGNLGATAGANIKATISCPPHALPKEPVCAKVDYPAWNWMRADYTGKISAPLALGNDKWGLTMLPSGRYFPISGNNPARAYGGTGTASVLLTSSQMDNNNILRRIIEGARRHPGLARSTQGKTVFGSVRCVR